MKSRYLLPSVIIIGSVALATIGIILVRGVRQSQNAVPSRASSGSQWVRSDGTPPTGHITSCYLRLFADKKCQGTVVGYGECAPSGQCSTDGSGICTEMTGSPMTASFNSADGCRDASCVPASKGCTASSHASWMDNNANVYAQAPVVLQWKTTTTTQYLVCVNNSCAVSSAATATDSGCLNKNTGASCGSTPTDTDCQGNVNASAKCFKCSDRSVPGQVGILDFSCFAKWYGQTVGKP